MTMQAARCQRQLAENEADDVVKALRLRIADLEEQNHRLKRLIHAAEARIVALEADLGVGAGASGRVAALKAEVGRLRKALAFYADADWDSMSDSVYADAGKRAAEALGRKEQADA